jgi:hypothetical protein
MSEIRQIYTFHRADGFYINETTKRVIYKAP